jgi:c-di-AMP phosphodiesterase-like protein
MNFTTIILISLSVIQLITTIIILIIVNAKLKSTQSEITVLINITYDLLKETRDVDFDFEQLNNMINQLTAGLSTKEEEQAKTLPTPDIEEQITKTIEDQIATEVALAADLRAPYKDALRDIILRTVETYPTISVEYIARKVISMVEMYSK